MHKYHKNIISNKHGTNEPEKGTVKKIHRCIDKTLGTTRTRGSRKKNILKNIIILEEFINQKNMTSTGRDENNAAVYHISSETKKKNTYILDILKNI